MTEESGFRVFEQLVSLIYVDEHPEEDHDKAEKGKEDSEGSLDEAHNEVEFEI